MKKLFLMLLIIPVYIACDDYDDDDPTSNEFIVTIENTSSLSPFISGGVFNTPAGSGSMGQLMPGDQYEFQVRAGKNHRLSFVTMWVQSNDLFLAPGGEGIPLYQNGNPVDGDVTDSVFLWDAGTEVNEEPGVGPNIKPNQDPTAEDVGQDEDKNIRKISNVNDGYTYPAVDEVIQIDVEPQQGMMFQITITNVSNDMTLQTSEGEKAVPLSPGVFAVHSNLVINPFFTAGEPDRGQGIEDIAEDGFPMSLSAHVNDNTGFIYPLSPGAYAVHEEGEMPLFMENAVDYDDGLEAIAEDGTPGLLTTSLDNMDDLIESGAFNTPDGANQSLLLGPGDSYSFAFEAEEGDYLSLATMYVQSNDLFYAFDDGGIPLFDGGAPFTGDVTDQLSLWDAGTEVNEEPGYGPNQLLRQGSTDTGPDEDEPIVLVDDNFSYLNTSDAIKVTISN